MRPTNTAPRQALGRDFGRLLAAASLSSLAEGTLKVTLPLLALSYTTSPLSVAGTGFALSLPWLLFALPAGALIDRHDRRRAMLLANLARSAALAAAAGLALAGLGSVWMLYLAAFTAGTAETFYASAAQALVPVVVPERSLVKANALQHLSDQVIGQLAGPAIGGVIAGLGAGAALAGPAAAWSAAMALVLLVKCPPRETPAGFTTTIRADVLAGLRFLRASVVLRSLSLCVAITNFAGSAAAAVFVVHAVGPASTLKLDQADYGLLLAASTIGAVAGAPVVGLATTRFGHRPTLAVNVITQAIQILIPLLTPNTGAIALGYALGGFGLALWNVGTVTLRQRIIPNHLLGRVVSTHRLISWGSLSLGALAGGALAEAAGTGTALITAAAGTLLGILALVPVHPHRVERAAG